MAAPKKTKKAEKQPPLRTATGIVRQEIITRLRDGRLAPGSRIVAAELAAELDLSRVPVREALHILAGEGVIDLQRNRGARIRPVTQKDVIDVFRVHGALCSLALSLLVERIGHEISMAEVDEKMNFIHEALRVHDAMRFYRTSQEFFNFVVAKSGSFALNLAYSNLHVDYFNTSFAVRLPGPHWDRFALVYKGIHDGLRDKDADGVRSIYEAHMAWALRKFLSD
jgi:DNA-binding GntR family transcriptional regulator